MGRRLPIKHSLHSQPTEPYQMYVGISRLQYSILTLWLFILINIWGIYHIYI